MKDDIDSAIRRCLEHQQWILGPEVQEFEDKVAEYLGVRHCIGTSSGTDALVLALRALALKTKRQEYFDRSDLIITTPFTFTATGDAILRAGATPAFIDIDPVSYNIDPNLIHEFLSGLSSAEQSRVKGIIPVHLYGQSCEMDQIMSIANEYNLFIVEDVAQAFGGGWKGRKLGSIGTVGAFSFFPSKNLGGFGDAGMVSTSDNEIAELVRILLKHGGKDKYNVDHIGYNARLDTLQAAILLAKLKHVDEFNIRRRHVAELYIEGLKDVERIVLPVGSEEFDVKGCAGYSSRFTGFSHVFHQFTIRILASSHSAPYAKPLEETLPRDALRQYLQCSNIDNMVYYPVPLNLMRLFDGGCAIVPIAVRNAESAAQQILSLPIEPLMTDNAVKRIIMTVKNYMRTINQVSQSLRSRNPNTALSDSRQV
jgi:dTDP-4-amino-4,6-dideoxygalactose transaminase